MNSEILSGLDRNDIVSAMSVRLICPANQVPKELVESPIRTVENPVNSVRPESRPVYLDKSTGLYIFECPHCNLITEVEQNQVNCHIFRHAFLYETVNGQIILTHQLNPHAPKSLCDMLKEQGKILGCGKPFRFIRNEDGTYRAEICDYI